MAKTIVALDERELATVLAALRYWQNDMNGEDGYDREDSPIATSEGTLEPLSDPEIDALCERVNVAGDTTGMLALVKRFKATLEYYARLSLKDGDEEGHNLKMLTARIEVEPVIDAMEG